MAVTAEVAGNQPAESAVLSGSRRTQEKGPESTVRAAAVTTTAANDSAHSSQGRDASLRLMCDDSGGA